MPIERLRQKKVGRRVVGFQSQGLAKFPFGIFKSDHFFGTALGGGGPGPGPLKLCSEKKVHPSKIKPHPRIHRLQGLGFQIRVGAEALGVIDKEENVFVHRANERPVESIGRVFRGGLAGGLGGGNNKGLNGAAFFRRQGGKGTFLRLFLNRRIKFHHIPLGQGPPGALIRGINPERRIQEPEASIDIRAKRQEG